ncbi:MAG: prolipoprotein diacylglyceryl transferase [Clostridiales bacterium GWB2_37_7]|nr:MAG: prolipoprotein diacylglyceryl transferase [Clostridiales bacterium GWB2_37_7]
MKEIFKIGHYGIYLLGVTIALGMLAGLFIALRESKRKGLDPDKILNLLTYSIIAAVLGARLYYIVAFDFQNYLENPLQIFAFRSGGLSIQGSIMAGGLFAFWYARRNKIPFLRVGDAFAPAIVMGQVIGRIGCDVYGVPMKTVYAWGVNYGGKIVHPVQIYEVLLNLIFFTYLWMKRGKTKYEGELFINYVIGFSIIRGAVEFFRTNPIVIGPFTIAHVTSFIILIAALIAARFIKKRQMSLMPEWKAEEVKIPAYEYIIIALIGIIGVWFFYSIQ